MRVGWGECDWRHSMAHPWKPTCRHKNLAKIFYTSRAIANFVPNFVAMATGFSGGWGSTGSKYKCHRPRKPYPWTKNYDSILHTTEVMTVYTILKFFPYVPLYFFKFFEYISQKLNFYFVTSKRHFLARNRVIWHIKRKNRFNGLACRRVEEPKKSVVNFEQEGCIFHLYGEQKPLGGLSPNFFWW